FAIGVLLYWLTTNLWTMGQQFYTIRRMPAPGSLAEKALEARRLKSGKEHKKFTIPGLTPESEPEEVQDSAVTETKPQSGQRQQPKRKNRGKPVGQGDAKPGPAQRLGPVQKSVTKPLAAADGDASSGTKLSEF
ncbi:MAG TPA: membrane protein insertase YidC, partial [Dermatophilaceae bacterium]